MRAVARKPDAVKLMSIPMVRDTIVKRSVKDQVGTKLAALIASGILRVGDTLPGERDLALALNVSRETVRGAIQALAAQGVLDVSHGARTRVVRPDVGAVTIGFASARAIDAYRVEDVHEARLLVESKLVAAAATALTDETLAELAKLLRAQQAAADDPVRFLISDREFHVLIYKTSGLPLLADFATDLYGYVMDRRRQAVSQQGAIASSTRDHVAIYEALARRDAEAAVAAFRAHTERIFDSTRSQLAVRTAPH